MNPYFSVFFESIWCASIIPFGRQPTFFAILGFGGYHTQAATAIAIAGSMLGLLFNWWVGTIILKQYVKGKVSLKAVNYEKSSRIFKRYLWFTLLLCWNPMVNYFSLVAAFLNVRLRVALPLMLAGQTGYYLYALLNRG